MLPGGKTSAGAFLMFGCSKTEKRVDVGPVFEEAIAMIGEKGGVVYLAASQFIDGTFY